MTAGAAQAQTIAASDPEGMAEAMRNAGFGADLRTDDMGDPLIETDLNGYRAYVLFYDCDEETNDGCESVQFSTGMDREQPMALADALALSAKYRFIGVRLDDEGDPFFQWDVVTGDGIPSSVFFTALRRYGEVISDVGDIVFADD